MKRLVLGEYLMYKMYALLGGYFAQSIVLQVTQVTLRQKFRLAIDQGDMKYTEPSSTQILHGRYVGCWSTWCEDFPSAYVAARHALCVCTYAKY